MREGLPSVTAGFVSFARAVASSRPMSRPALHDSTATSLLPWPVTALVPRGPLRSVAQGALRVASLGLVDHVALRTAAIDEAVTEAVARGVTQVVILGAGLDARAYRLDALRSAAVYEVDHPDSQRYKRARLAGLRPRAGSLKHVAVDFAVDDLGARLDEAGHRADRPTCWIFEGVTMYLPPDATRGTLDTVAKRSGEGSRLAMTYMSGPAYALPRPLRSVVDVTMGAFGEPLRTTFSPADVDAMLRPRKYTVTSDTDATDWTISHGASAAMAVVFRIERLVVADGHAPQADAT